MTRSKGATSFMRVSPHVRPAASTTSRLPWQAGPWKLETHPGQAEDESRTQSIQHEFDQGQEKKRALSDEPTPRLLQRTGHVLRAFSRRIWLTGSLDSRERRAAKNTWTLPVHVNLP